MENPEFYTGEPVEPRDLWFREPFIAQLWENLRQRHVLLSAPRRTGKTSVMIHLMEHPQHGYLVVYQNVQDLKHPAELFQTILDNFADTQPHTFQQIAAGGWKLIKDAMKNVESVGAGGFKVAIRKSDDDWKANWRKHGEDLLSELRRLDTPVLIIVDELPDMILNVRTIDEGQAREFVSWLRVHRQNPRPSQDTIRWLFGGSINLAGTLDEMGEVDSINDLAVETLPILTDDEVNEFVVRMLTSVKASYHATLPAQVALRLGQPIPLFLQLITQDLYRLWKKEERELTAADVDSVFEALVTSPSARDKLQHYYSRIERYYQEPGQSAAHAILSVLALSGSDGLHRSTLEQEFNRTLDALGQPLTAPKRKQAFNQLLQDLENDFYVIEIANRHFDFASGLMKAWWKKYYA